MPEFQKEIGTWLVCVCAKQLTFKVHFENENTIAVFMQKKKITIPTSTIVGNGIEKLWKKFNFTTFLRDVS